MTEREVRVVGIALFHSGRCLAAQRSERMAFPLRWEFPGGKIEPGESPSEALAREIAEELGVEVTVGEFLGRGSASVGGKTVVLDVYSGTLLAGTPRAIEHRALRWCSSDELEQLWWAEADVPIVPAVQAALRRASDG